MSWSRLVAAPRRAFPLSAACLGQMSCHAQLCARCDGPHTALCSAVPVNWLTRALQRPFHEGLAMTRKLVSKKELKSVYGVPYCFAHVARLEAAGKFPKRVTLGACRVAWVAEEVEAWIEERVANRTQTSPS